MFIESTRHIDASDCTQSRHHTMSTHASSPRSKKLKKQKSKPKPQPVPPPHWNVDITGRLVILIIAVGLVILFTPLPSLPQLVWRFVWGATSTPASHSQSLTLSTHFLSALDEIATSVPRLDALTLAPQRHGQYGVRRRQIDMIEGLSYTASLVVDEAGLARQVLDIKALMYKVHGETTAAEDAFKEAVARIDSTTAFILKELPLLNVQLYEGRVCDSLAHLNSIISTLGSLIGELETATVPVAQLRQDVTRLVSDIGILESQLQYMHHKTSVGLVSHDQQSEAYRVASWFTALSRPDQQKYEQLVLLHRSIGDMQLSTHYLDETFERSEVQIQIALNHLRGTNRRLTDIYVELGRSATRIETARLDTVVGDGVASTSRCDASVRFAQADVIRLAKLGDETLEKLQWVRRCNEPILGAIAVHGYGAISAG